MLTRSQSAARGVGGKTEKIGLVTRVAMGIWGQVLAWTYIGMANLLAPNERPWGYKTLAIKRHRLRALANRLGVRQRSLYFALVTYALNGEGPTKHMSKAVIAAAYTLLEGRRTDIDDDFLRVRALMAKFRVKEDFVEYVREIDATVGKLEAKDVSKFMALMTSALSAAVALVVRSEDALAPLMNTVSQPIFLLSGILLPMLFAPLWLLHVAKWNPFSWAVDGTRALFAGDIGNDKVWQGLLIVGVLTVLSVVWAARKFATSVR